MSPGLGGFFGSQRTITCAPSSVALANFTDESAGLPYTKASAPSSSTTSTRTLKPFEAGAKPSGRIPTVTVAPADATVKFANATDEGAQVIVRWDPKNPPKPGQTITVGVNPAAVHLFNAATGERIK